MRAKTVNDCSAVLGENRESLLFRYLNSLVSNFMERDVLCREMFLQNLAFVFIVLVLHPRVVSITKIHYRNLLYTFCGIFVPGEIYRISKPVLSV